MIGAISLLRDKDRRPPPQNQSRMFLRTPKRTPDVPENSLPRSPLFVNGRCGLEPARYLWVFISEPVVGEGLVPSRGRPQGPPLQRGIGDSLAGVADEPMPFPVKNLQNPLLCRTPCGLSRLQVSGVCAASPDNEPHGRHCRQEQHDPGEEPLGEPVQEHLSGKGAHGDHRDHGEVEPQGVGGDHVE